MGALSLIRYWTCKWYKPGGTCFCGEHASGLDGYGRKGYCAHNHPNNCLCGYADFFKCKPRLKSFKRFDNWSPPYIGAVEPKIKHQEDEAVITHVRDDIYDAICPHCVIAGVQIRAGDAHRQCKCSMCGKWYFIIAPERPALKPAPPVQPDLQTVVEVVCKEMVRQTIEEKVEAIIQEMLGKETKS